jgi:hypothetical protein
MAPNMNPQRNNCLHDDYTKGDRLLGQCYSSLLTTFWDLVSGSPTTKASAQAEDEIEEDFDEADFAPRPTCAALDYYYYYYCYYYSYYYFVFICVLLICWDIWRVQ